MPISHTVIIFIFQTLYILALAGMSAYGIHCLINIILYLRTKDQPLKTIPLDEMLSWPDVTVQLPVFNEQNIVERLIAAITTLDYPSEHLQIQVLDDSTDDTTQLVERIVNEYQAKGFDIQTIHRTDRSGFKAGNLKNGFKSARGEFIAIFDSDFLPPPKWLKQAVCGFSDDRIGCVQTRWGHLNQNMNVISRAVALGLDSHFIVEQTARSRNGLFLNFNGSAGIWRKACIEDAGGWQIDTLTEDMDLSFRAQIKGWRIAYLPDVVANAELPFQVAVIRRQQFRWAKGNLQVIRKIMPAFLCSNTSLFVRIMGFLHLTGYFLYPFTLITLLLMLPIGIYAPQVLFAYPWAAIASIGLPVMGLISRTEQTPRLIDRLVVLPFLILIGVGLSLSNTIAVIQGIFRRDMGEFERTPKINMTSSKKAMTILAQHFPLGKEVWFELLLGFFALLVIRVLVPIIGPGIIPWGSLYICGYFFIAGLSIYQNFQTAAKK